MVNESIRIGIANNVSSLRKLSLLSYNRLAQYDSPSYYKLCAISRAVGILAARKKSVRRGYAVKTPYAVRQQLVSCYGFKTKNGQLEISVSRGKRLSIPLTKHTSDIISQPGVTVRSFTLTRDRLSLCIARDVAPVECASTVGVDRNLRNLTVGNDVETRHYDLSETVRIAKTTVRIIASFNRLCGVVKNMISPSSSSLSILGRYLCSYPGIVSSERGDYPHRGLGYSYSLRLIVVTCLHVVSNREITKITVYTDGRRAFYRSNVAGDAEAQSVPGECEGAYSDSWLRDDV